MQGGGEAGVDGEGGRGVPLSLTASRRQKLNYTARVEDKGPGIPRTHVSNG